VFWVEEKKAAYPFGAETEIVPWGRKGHAVNDGQSVSREGFAIEGGSTLDSLALEGARRMIATALEAEVAAFLERHAAVRDERGRRVVIRNGHLPERVVATGAGGVTVKAPRVRDLRGADDEESVTFTSSILPKYLRRSKKIDEFIPWLYLRGVSTNDMQTALEALVGPEAKGFSSGVVTRLTAAWEQEQDAWSRRDLSKAEYIYVWVDGIHFNLRISGAAETERQCVLVLMGATPDGKKELVAIQDGIREDEQSWKEMLLDLKKRGLKLAPKVAVGDGALGFWAALEKVFPGTRIQRCWVHKTANVLAKLPKGVQDRAKADLHEIWMAETRQAAGKAFDLFVEKYQAKFPKAVECLTKDRDALLAFYDFPAEHWKHLRTTNPIESTFATVRHRTTRTKGSASRSACLAFVFKLTKLAEKGWRRLQGQQLLLKLLAGHKFVDGVDAGRNAA
jgi:transposase-like protein